MKKTIFVIIAVLVFSAFSLSSCTDNNMLKPDATKTSVATLPATKTPSKLTSTPTPDVKPDVVVTPLPDTIITPDISPDTTLTTPITLLPTTDTLIPDPNHFSRDIR